MYVRLFLLAALVYFAPKAAFAKTVEKSAIELEDQPEEVIHKQSLAVQMGLTPTDAVFGKPRQFRSDSSNNFGLDPITDEEP